MYKRDELIVMGKAFMKRVPTDYEPSDNELEEAMSAALQAVPRQSDYGRGYAAGRNAGYDEARNQQRGQDMGQ